MKEVFTNDFDLTTLFIILRVFEAQLEPILEYEDLDPQLKIELHHLLNLNRRVLSLIEEKRRKNENK